MLQVQPGGLNCTIRVRGEGLTPPAVFQGEMLFPLVRDLPAEHRRMLIRARFFRLDWQASGKTIDFTLEGSLFEAELKLEEWRQHLRLLELLSQTSIEFEVEQGDDGHRQKRAVPLTFRTPRELDSWVLPMMEVIRRSQALLSMVGADDKPTTLKKLGESAVLVSHAYHCLVDPQAAPPPSFESTNPAPGAILGDMQFLQAGCVIIAHTLLAYSCRTTMRPQSSGDSLVWRQVDIQQERIAVVEHTVQAYNDFVAHEKQRTGLQSTIVATPRTLENAN